MTDSNKTDSRKADYFDALPIAASTLRDVFSDDWWKETTWADGPPHGILLFISGGKSDAPIEKQITQALGKSFGTFQLRRLSTTKPNTPFYLITSEHGKDNYDLARHALDDSSRSSMFKPKKEGEYAYFFTNPYPPKDPTPPPPATPTYSTSARLDDVTSFNPPAEFIPPSATLSDPTSFDFPSAPAHDDASDVPTATRTRPDSYNPPGAWTGKEDDSDEE